MRLKTALIGCGQIADAHLQELRKLHDTCEVVAVCDLYRDLAYQAAARFEVPGIYDNVARMLDEVKPDVVHITTSAQSHAPLAIQAINAGCHVFVEKPFSLDVAEADRIIAAAQQKNVKLCLGHDQLFDPMWLRVKELIATDAVGTVGHVESVLGYPISGQFGAVVTADPNHWVRKLPGGLFQNTISHPLYRITDLLADPQPQIDAIWHTRGKYPFPTELRVNLRGGGGSGGQGTGDGGPEVTGTLLFTAASIPQRLSRVYGTKGWLEVNFDSQVIRLNRAAKLPGAFGKLELPFRHWREGARNLRRNLWRFWKCEIQFFAGMKNLFQRFHRSILFNEPLPIAPEEMRRVTWIMDEIFRQCREREHATACRCRLSDSESRFTREGARYTKAPL